MAVNAKKVCQDAFVGVGFHFSILGAFSLVAAMTQGSFRLYPSSPSLLFGGRFVLVSNFEVEYPKVS